VKSWIYFAQHGVNGPIKIGHAFDPRKRVMDLAVGSPVAITLLGAALSEHAEEEEAQIHERLRKQCVRGEWFVGEVALREMERLGTRMIAPDEVIPQETPNDVLNANMNVRASPEELTAWKAAAQREGMSLSQWTRNQLNAEELPSGKLIAVGDRLRILSGEHVGRTGVVIKNPCQDMNSSVRREFAFRVDAEPGEITPTNGRDYCRGSRGEFITDIDSFELERVS
jgi:Meiotically up-regulated gene 113